MSRRARERENARPWESWQQQRDDELDAPDEFPDPDDDKQYSQEREK